MKMKCVVRNIRLYDGGDLCAKHCGSEIHGHCVYLGCDNLLYESKFFCNSHCFTETHGHCIFDCSESSQKEVNFV